MEFIDKIILLRNSLSDCIFDDGVISGFLLLNSDLIDIIREIESGYIEDLFDENNTIINSDNLYIGQRIYLKLVLSSISSYYESLADFILKNQLHEPSVYYIHELNYQNNINDIPSQILVYRDVLSIISLLKSISDFEKIIHDKQQIVLVQSRSVSFYTNFSHFILNAAFSDILQLSEQFSKDKLDRIERIAIFKTETISLLNKSEDPNNYFNYLLSNWSELLNSFKKSYELYLEGFSYEKLKSELEKQKIDISKKIHDILDGIGSKLIAIPIGYFLIFSQFDYSGSDFWKNTGLLLAGLLSTLFINILLQNQKNQLFILEKHIKNLTVSFSKHTDFLTVFNALDLSQKKQLSMLKTIQFSIWIIFSFTSILYLFTEFCSITNFFINFLFCSI